MTDDPTYHEKLSLRVGWPTTEEEFLGVIHQALGFARASMADITTAYFDEGAPAEKREAAKVTSFLSYNSTAEALFLCALAAFRYACAVVGPSSFQAGWASMLLLSETNPDVQPPFAILQAHDMLWPQTDPLVKAKGWVEGWRSWAKEEAAKKLAADPVGQYVHPTILEHWRALAAWEPAAAPTGEAKT